MKTVRSYYWLVLIGMIVLGGCGPQTTATSSAVVNTPEAIPITNSGPVMEVGSTFLYADGAVLVAVPAGPFTMGYKGADYPERTVTLPDYWIYRTEVTNHQYEYCVNNGGCTSPSGSDNPGFSEPALVNEPVVGVDYNQASAYCSFVHARLPTEAEWEKAARGPNANIYPWGNNTPNCALANYLPCEGETTPVTDHPDGQSYYQAFDMAGNVFEWVFDFYQQDYYISGPTDNPQGPERGPRHVVRSSAFDSGANQTQVYNRFSDRPTDHRSNLGFRCVVDDPDYFASYCVYPAVYGTDGIGGAKTGVGVKVECPDLTITQNPTCSGTTPVTEIDLPSPDQLGSGYHIMYQLLGNCMFSSVNGSDASCSSQGEIKTCGDCKVTVTIPPQCPQNYSYDSNSKNCVGKGTPGTCLPGTTAEVTASGVCCNLIAPIAAPTAKPLTGQITFVGKYQPPVITPACPSGASVAISVNGNPICVAPDVDYPYCNTQKVLLSNCAPPGPGGGGGDGQPQGCPPQSCGTNYAWDPSSCSCVCDGC